MFLWFFIWLLLFLNFSNLNHFWNIKCCRKHKKKTQRHRKYCFACRVRNSVSRPWRSVSTIIYGFPAHNAAPSARSSKIFHHPPMGIHVYTFDSTRNPSVKILKNYSANGKFKLFYLSAVITPISSQADANFHPTVASLRCTLCTSMCI